MTLLMREGESFTASTDCPSCGVVDVHYLDAPRLAPTDDSPLSQAQRRIAYARDTLYAVSGSSARTYDPPDTAVARICTACAHRWGQR